MKKVCFFIFSVSNAPHNTTSLTHNPPHTLLPHTPLTPWPWLPCNMTTMSTNAYMVRSHLSYLKLTNMTCRDAPQLNGWPAQHSIESWMPPPSRATPTALKNKITQKKIRFFIYLFFYTHWMHSSTCLLPNYHYPMTPPPPRFLTWWQPPPGDDDGPHPAPPSTLLPLPNIINNK
jgi:hypothetical protein